MKNIITFVLAAAALLILLAYHFGYQYLFHAISQTYAKGKTGVCIDDGKDSPSNKIENQGKIKTWQLAKTYNQINPSKTLQEHLEKYKTSSFLVIKDDKILYENYWQQSSQQTQNNSFSMSKSVISLLVGIAIEEQKIRSEEQKLGEFYPYFSTQPHAKNCRLKDLLAMQSGLDWSEKSGAFSPNAKAYYTNNLASVFLKTSFAKEPQTSFEYLSGNTQLLGFCLRKAIGKSISQYTSEKLWTPLGMESFAFWNTDRKDGMERTFCCLNATARDYAKIASLLLHKGNVDGKQIVSQAWIDKMITPSTISKNAYGYGIWVNNDFQMKHYYLQGTSGQYAICIPERNMIIIRTGFCRDSTKDDKQRPKEVEFLVEQTLASFCP